MSDEQQDEAVSLPAILGTVVLAVLVALSGLWLVEGVDWRFFSRVQVEKLAMEDRVEMASAYLARRETLEARRLALVQWLRQQSDSHIAPHFNPLGWASGILNRHAANTGLTVDAIVPLAGREVPWIGDDTQPRALTLFPVRIDTVGTEKQLAAFLSELEAENPYLCAISMTVLDSRGEKTRRMTAVIEWPIWEQNARADYVRRLMSNIR